LVQLKKKTCHVKFSIGRRLWNPFIRGDKIDLSASYPFTTKPQNGQPPTTLCRQTLWVCAQQRSDSSKENDAKMRFTRNGNFETTGKPSLAMGVLFLVKGRFHHLICFVTGHRLKWLVLL